MTTWQKQNICETTSLVMCGWESVYKLIYSTFFLIWMIMSIQQPHVTTQVDI